MNGRSVGELVGIILLGTAELLVTGILLCVGWHYGTKLVNRLENSSGRKKLAVATAGRRGKRLVHQI